MCADCRMTPCHPRCPNAPEEKPIETCYRCKKGIMEGEKFLSTSDGSICEECLENFSVHERLEMIGESLIIAEREE